MPGIEVHIRVRPVSEGKNIWSSSDSLLFCTEKKDARFAFHRVHPASVSNATLYNNLEPLTHSAFSGQNVTVMAFGQTGSGKTHCMTGSPTDPGLIPRAAKTLMDLVNQYAHEGATIEVGLIEIYNEAIFDLLATTNREKMIYDAPDGISVLYVPREQKTTNNSNNNNNGNSSDRRMFGGGATASSMAREGSQFRESSLQQDAASINNNNAAGSLPPGASMQNGRILISLNNIQDYEQALHIAERNRRYGETDLNKRSSRSHVILNFEITRRVGGQVQRSVLQFVDLAGSESAHKANTTGSALAEGGHINKSLLALGNVVTAIAEKRQVVSFRESNLTRILRNCLGGKALTYLITCINPTRENLEQTYQSLKFAERAMNIRSDPGITLSMAPLIVHQVWKSLRARQNLMKEREERAYELGIQETYLQCRESIGNILASVDADVQAHLRENQVLAYGTLAHDQQRALHAIQQAQQLVRHEGTSTTLVEAEEALDFELRREEDITESSQVAELIAQVQAAEARIAQALDEAEICDADLEAQIMELHAMQRDVVTAQHTARFVKIEGEYWQGLEELNRAKFRAIYPRVDADAAPPVGMAQLRDLKVYHDNIIRGNQEIEALKESIALLNGINAEAVDFGFHAGHEEFLLSGHIASLEENVRYGGGGAGGLQHNGNNSNKHKINSFSSKSSPTSYGHLFNSDNYNKSSSIATAGSYYATSSVPLFPPSTVQNMMNSRMKSKSPRVVVVANENSNNNGAKIINASANIAPSRSVSPRAKIVVVPSSNNNHNNIANRSISPVPVSFVAGGGNTIQRASAAQLLQNINSMFSAEELASVDAAPASTTATTTSNHTKTFANSMRTSQPPPSSSSFSQYHYQNNNSSVSKILPRSPRPRDENILLTGNNGNSISNRNNNNNTINGGIENLQRVPSNSANRAIDRANKKMEMNQQQQQRETRKLENASSEFSNNNNNFVRASNTRSPVPNNNNNAVKGTVRGNSRSNMNNNNTLKNTTRLEGNNFEDSRDRVDLNLFDGQSPVAGDLSSSNNNKIATTRGRKK